MIKKGVEYIKNGLLVLKNEFKYEIKGFIVDGAKQIKKAIEEIYPKSKIQRCLTHIFRQIKNNICDNHKSECGKNLQKIITFENFKSKDEFIKKFNAWEKKYFDFLKDIVSLDGKKLFLEVILDILIKN